MHDPAQLHRLPIGRQAAMMIAPTTTPEGVRARILADHASLRHLLAALAREIAAERRGEVGAEALMKHVLAGLCETLLTHLAYGEAELAPLLRSADAWGVVVATHLLDEHGAQRATILALAEDADAGKTREELADEIGWFIHGVLRDLEEEEKLLTPEALGEEYIVVDQTCG